MNQKQLEKLLKRVVAANEMLAIAQANMTETNDIIVDVLLAMNVRAAEIDNTPPTMQ